MARWNSYIDDNVGDGSDTIAGIIANGPTYGIGISPDVYVTGIATFTNVVKLNGQLRDGDNNFGSSGQVLSSDGTDTRWINAAQLSAGAASQIAVNDDGNTNAFRFLTFVDSSSGNNTLKTDSVIKYNPSTNILNLNATASGIKFGTGDALNDDAHIEWLGGNNAGYLRISTSDDGGSEYIQFGDYDLLDRGGTFTQWLRISRNTGTFTGTFSATTFSGSGASLTSLNASNISSGTINAARVPTLNQNTTGSAATLTTARTIGGVSFDGSANINLPGVNQAGNQNTSGNAATATVLETTRNFSISGEITANSQSFNGSGNVTLSATVDDNVIDYNNLKASNRTSATNGQYLRKQSGNTGGMTWEDIPVVTGSNLTGNTLSSNIVSSSLTSLGTLNSLSVSGTVDINDTITLDSKNETPQHDRGVIIIQPSTSGGSTGITFRSKVNSTSDHGYLWWYDDNDNYNVSSSANGENGAMIIGVDNDPANAAGDVVAIESTGNIFLNPGGSYGGASGPSFSNGKVYIGRAATKYQVWHEGNDGPSSGLNADLLDGEEGSYYRNAGNLNAGTIPTARLPNHSASLLTSGTIPDARISGNFLRSDQSDTLSGDLTVTGNIVIGDQIRIGDDAFIEDINVANTIRIKGNQDSNQGFIAFGSQSKKLGHSGASATLTYDGYTVWHSGNDGSGSGLSADFLDGQHGSHYLNYNNLSNKPTIPTQTSQLTNNSGFITGTDVRSMNEAASTGQSSTSSESYSDKVTLSISTVSNSRVLVFYSYEIRHSDTSNKLCRGRVTGSNTSFVGGNRDDSNKNTSFQRFNGNVLDISSHTGTRTYRIQFSRTSGGSGTIRNASLCAIEMSV